MKIIEFIPQLGSGGGERFTIDLCNELAKRHEVILVVSHSLESTVELCDRVVWIEHGKLIKMGKTKEICDEYYKKQIK